MLMEKPNNAMAVRNVLKAVIFPVPNLCSMRSLNRLDMIVPAEIIIDIIHISFKKGGKKYVTERTTLHRGHTRT